MQYRRCGQNLEVYDPSLGNSVWEAGVELLGSASAEERGETRDIRREGEWNETQEGYVGKAGLLSFPVPGICQSAVRVLQVRACWLLVGRSLQGRIGD